MKRYRVMHDYTSHYAHMNKGDEVELVEPLAEWVNRDCPGTLEEIKPPAPELQADRMLHKPERKRKANA